MPTEESFDNIGNGSDLQRDNEAAASDDVIAHDNDAITATERPVSPRSKGISGHARD